MNYDEAMNYIRNTAKFGSNYGLERTEKILEILDNPHKNIKCIHIAGTNGKGSTTAMLCSILKEAGYSVGMYTSPYLEEFEERIQINNNNIAKEDLSNIITEVSYAVDGVIKQGYDHPTEFEIITCAAFLYFYKMRVDFAVVEVGLGGRLDSTNVITPLMSIITSISYDHMQILGDTLEKIALEKAGIIKENVPVILYPQEKECELVIENIGKSKKSNLIKVLKECGIYVKMREVSPINMYYDDSDTGIYAQQITIETANRRYNLNLALLGEHQILNCATVLNAVEELIHQGFVINDKAIQKGLIKVRWKGRLEVMNKKPLIVIDGAHNIDGIKKLKDSIELYFKYKKLVLIIGVLADKQVKKMVETIAPIADRIITVTPHSERAEIAEELLNIVKEYNNNCEAIVDYEEAYLKAVKYSSAEDAILLCGSLYMIGDMRKIITKNKF
ncbi:MAG: folylpolyglutamate synthase/dihydrofolate synthase family protein [Bacillota bacterium]|nr:folylpolyglutamate synthase/dihydrofolate synthase family protein [Bacillota bacterium]